MLSTVAAVQPGPAETAALLIERIVTECSSLLAQAVAWCVSGGRAAEQIKQVMGQQLQLLVDRMRKQIEKGGKDEVGACAAAAVAAACLAGCKAAVMGAGQGGNGGGMADNSSAGEAAQHAQQGRGPDPDLLVGVVGPLEAALHASLLISRESDSSGSSGSWMHQHALGHTYGGLAQCLLLRCSGHAATEGLQQMGHSAELLGSVASDLHAALALVDGSGEGGQASPPPRISSAVCAGVVDFVSACCTLTHHLKPAASTEHFASLAAVVLHLLRVLPPPPTGLAPLRPPTPFWAIFPACHVSTDGTSTTGLHDALRPPLLEALRRLVSEASTRDLSMLLRFAAAALPAARAVGQLDPAWRVGSGAEESPEAHLATLARVYKLQLSELVLMALEASSSGRVLNQLSRHSERLVSALTHFVLDAAGEREEDERDREDGDDDGAGMAPAVSPGLHALLEEREAKRTNQPSALTLGMMASMMLAGAPGGEPAGAAPPEAPQHAQQVDAPSDPAAAAARRFMTSWSAPPPAPEDGWYPRRVQPLAESLPRARHRPAHSPLDAYDVPALCTALRALESVAGRPHAFELAPRHVRAMLKGVDALWRRLALRPGSDDSGGDSSSGGLPGFSYRLGVRSGAALFQGSCTLLTALLRHRQGVSDFCLRTRGQKAPWAIAH